MLWGKLHQFANELMAPEDEEDEEYEQEQKQHYQQPSSTNRAPQHPQNQFHQQNQREDAFFSQTFLPGTQQQQHRASPVSFQQPPQHHYHQNVPNQQPSTYPQQQFYNPQHYQQQRNPSPVNSQQQLLRHGSSNTSTPSSRTTSPQQQFSQSPPNVTTSYGSSTAVVSPVLDPSMVYNKQSSTHTPSTPSLPYRSSTPIIKTAVEPLTLPSFSLAPLSFSNEVTRTDKKDYIHIKLFVGDEVFQQDQHVEYLQNQITFLQNELRANAERFEREKMELRQSVDQSQHAYREQALKLNEYLEKNRRLEYDIHQTNQSSNNHFLELENTINELNAQKKKHTQIINEQNTKLQQVYSEFTREQQTTRQYAAEVERLQNIIKSMEIQRENIHNTISGRETQLAELESALELLQMTSDRDVRKLKESLKQKDEELTKYQTKVVELSEKADHVAILQKQVELLQQKLNEQEISNPNDEEQGSSQSEVIKRMLEDCMSRLNDENLVDRRVVSRMLLALVSNHNNDLRQQQAIFKFLINTLNINILEDEQVLQNALVFLQQERFKQILTRKKTFSELFVNYLMEEAKPTKSPAKQ